MMKQLVSLGALCTAVGLSGCVGGSSAPSAAANMSSNGGMSEVLGANFIDSSDDASQYQANAVKDASFATLINGVRTQNGVGTLSYNTLLDQAAQGHADDMLALDYFSHDSADGRRLSDRVNATGYQWRKIGENIGKGQTSEQEVLTGWVQSPTHQANNIDPEFEEFGLGRAGSGSSTRWVLVFGDPSN